MCDCHCNNGECLAYPVFASELCVKLCHFGEVAANLEFELKFPSKQTHTEQRAGDVNYNNFDPITFLS